MDSSPQSFLARNDFLIRRLHSLSGLVPVGGYMVIHLMTNASVLESPATFQKNVYTIHSLGALLPFIEWTFIFIPILFHAIIGMVIVAGGMPNNNQYRYAANYRYTLQRATGMIAFVYIMLHVFHLHGWFHGAAWLENVARPLGGAQFRAYNAASTTGLALQSYFWVAVYVVGVLSCVYHLANGLWTMGITWGVWTSDKAQARASAVCTGFGVLLAVVSMGALVGMRSTGAGEALDQAIAVEDQMYQAKIDSGELKPNEHKRTEIESEPESKSSESE
ncbi:MAG: succinate dehydrogenase cytochrome b558 subunit [Planctomycetota bacterium]